MNINYLKTIVEQRKKNYLQDDMASLAMILFWGQTRHEWNSQ